MDSIYIFKQFTNQIKFGVFALLALLVTACPENNSPVSDDEQTATKNKAPTAIALSKSSIAENSPANTVVGELSTTDANADDTHTYTILSGGSNFKLDSTKLRISKVSDFETKSSYTLKVETDDGKGGKFEAQFKISVIDVNDTPTAIRLSKDSIAENSPANTVVGTFSTTDADADDTHTYTLISGGSNFKVDRDKLLALKVFNHKTKSSYPIRVESSDGNGGKFQKDFVITVTKAGAGSNSPPTAMTLSATCILEKNALNAVIGRLSTTDADASDAHTYTLVACGPEFRISNDTLYASKSFDHKTQSSYPITIRTSDGKGGTFQKDFTIAIIGDDGLTFGGSSDDAAWSVVQTSDGGYVMVGETASKGSGGFDIWLVKVDACGTVQWDKTFGGSNDDYAFSVVQTADGGYALAGWTKSKGNGSADFWLVKVDASGNHQWDKTFGGTNHDEAHSVVQTADGGYALAGGTWSKGSGRADMWLIKVDASGNHQWDKTFGGSRREDARSMVQTSDGGYVLVGEIESKGSGGWDFWLVKVDASGNLQWDKTFGGSGSDRVWSVVQTADKGYALAGDTDSKGSGGTDLWLVKVDASGTLQWDKTFGGSDDDQALSVVQTADGGYALAGWTKSKGSGGTDFWLVKVDASGTLQWDKTFGGSDDDRAYSVIQAPNGGYVLAGWTKSKGSGSTDFWLVFYKW